MNAHEAVPEGRAGVGGWLLRTVIAGTDCQQTRLIVSCRALA